MRECVCAGWSGVERAAALSCGARSDRFRRAKCAWRRCRRPLRVELPHVRLPIERARGARASANVCARRWMEQAAALPSDARSDSVIVLYAGIDARSAHVAATGGGCVSSRRTCGGRSSERAVRAHAAPSGEQPQTVAPSEVELQPGA